MNRLFDAITDDWDSRINSARNQFRAVCQRTQLPRLFNGFSKWAIVGGAVRDVLLARNLNPAATPLDVADLDIAVDRPLSEQFFRDSKIRAKHELKIEYNSFGGMKLQSSLCGVVDVWSWETTAADNFREAIRNRLDQVDFGINAVAYLWPDDIVIVHPRWLTDLRGLVVEKLAKHSPHPEFQSVRACAIAAKLSSRTDYQFRLGDAVRGDIRELLWPDSQALEQALDYLTAKIEGKRWTLEAATRFRGEWNTLTTSSRIPNESGSTLVRNRIESIARHRAESTPEHFVFRDSSESKRCRSALRSAGA